MIKVITYGTYDLLHYGHIKLLERAKALGDYLIVGVTADDFDINRGKINVQQPLMERIEAVRKTGEHLSNSFAFLEEVFGDGESLSGSQEMVIFLTELSSAYHSLKFGRETGNEAYYKYNKLLLLSDRKQELKEMAQKLVF